MCIKLFMSFYSENNLLVMYVTIIRFNKFIIKVGQKLFTETVVFLSTINENCHMICNGMVGSAKHQIKFPSFIIIIIMYFYSASIQ